MKCPRCFGGPVTCICINKPKENEMSKTFKHKESNGNESKLDICQVPAGIRVTLSTHTTISGWFHPRQGAEIALAILEAAGVEACHRDYESYDDGSPAHLQAVMYFLTQYSEAQAARAAAEADRVALEQEALDLYQVWYSSRGGSAAETFKDLGVTAGPIWLAIARKAREILEAKEAGQ